MAGSNHFDIRKVARYEERLLRFDSEARVAVTEKGIYSGSRLEMAFDHPVCIGLASDGTVIAAWLEGRKLKLIDVNRGHPVSVVAEADGLMEYHGRIYTKTGDAICEMDLLRPSGTVFAAPVRVCSVLENATRMYDGVAVQDILGSCFVSVFPEKKTCLQVRIKELDGARITAAKYENGVLMAVAACDGKYDRHVIRIADDRTYDHSVVKDVGITTPNFVTMPSGVCVHLNEQEEIEVFSNQVGSTSVKAFKDPALSGDMRLTRDGSQAMFFRDDEMFAFEVRKKP